MSEKNIEDIFRPFHIKAQDDQKIVLELQIRGFEKALHFFIFRLYPAVCIGVSIFGFVMIKLGELEDDMWFFPLTFLALGTILPMILHKDRNPIYVVADTEKITIYRKKLIKGVDELVLDRRMIEEMYVDVIRHKGKSIATVKAKLKDKAWKQKILHINRSENKATVKKYAMVVALALATRPGVDIRE